MDHFDAQILEIIEDSDRFDTLSIGLEYDYVPEDSYPSLLFTPNKDEFEHYHIALNVEQAKALKNWLNNWINSLK